MIPLRPTDISDTLFHIIQPPQLLVFVFAVFLLLLPRAAFTCASHPALIPLLFNAFLVWCFVGVHCSLWLFVVVVVATLAYQIMLCDCRMHAMHIVDRFAVAVVTRSYYDSQLLCILVGVASACHRIAVGVTYDMNHTVCCCVSGGNV